MSTDLPGAAEMGDVASQPQRRAPDRDPEARQRTLDRKGKKSQREADQGRGPKEVQDRQAKRKEEAPGQNGGWLKEEGSSRR